MKVIGELHIALRSLARSKGVAATVIVTLGLGIGGNAAMVSLVRAVLLRPLANADEDRLLYIRQSAPGLGAENTTFSVPEIQDLRARMRTVTALGEFSTLPFTVIGLGEPRQVRAGVVSGNYFEVMGLGPEIGRLLNADDDGPKAPGAAVLTHRFWVESLQADPSVLGKTVRLDTQMGTRSAQIVGVLEPSVPYPAETELFANVVTSPHHLSAVMVTGREHRMTEVFGRLAPGASLEAARADLRTVHTAIQREHPEAYPESAGFEISAVPLRDQITVGARTMLLVLLVASGLVLVVACANVANLILAQSVRRESELALRSALGASRLSLRVSLFAETLLLCGAGALAGVLIAPPMAGVLARFASRFSVRALDFEVDTSFLWVGAVSAVVCAALLAFLPTLPTPERRDGLRRALNGVRVVGAAHRRLRVFAVLQIAASFVLVAGSIVLLRSLLALQAAETGFETGSVLAVNVPVTTYNRTPDQVRDFYTTLRTRVAAIPGVERVAIGSTVPWRDHGGLNNAFAFQIEGARLDKVGDDPRAKFRSVSPGFFEALGVPLLAGRDFSEGDRAGEESVVIVSESVAKELFEDRKVVDRNLRWTDGVMRFIGISQDPRRIVGVVADIDDERVDPGPAKAVYHPFDQQMAGGRLFVRAHGNPYALVPQITQTVRQLAADQPIENAATLEDIRAEVLAPERLNTVVFGGFAAVALAISIVGVAGMLVFSVSGRTRELGVRLALGSYPRSILMGVLADGAVLGVLGLVAGALGGWLLIRVAGRFVEGLQTPGALALSGAALVLLLAAVGASLAPAARAASINVVQALREE